MNGQRDHLSKKSLLGLPILVTGASGFIGTALCRKLIKEGAAVHGVSRVKHSTANPQINWWYIDLEHYDLVIKMLDKLQPEIIIHLAGYVYGSRELHHVLPAFRGNLLTTVNLLTAAAEKGCRRIILTGSLDDADALSINGTCSPYGRGKWACQAYAHMFHALYGLPLVTLRPFMVFGPGQQDLTKLVPYVALSLLRGESPRLSSGKRLCDWIYVEDVVDAYISSIHGPSLEGQTLDIGTGRLSATRDIVNHLVQLINPKIEPLFGKEPDRPFERERVADTRTAKDLLRWEASVNLETGLLHTAEWYRKFK